MRDLLRVAVIGLGWAANNIWLPRLASHPAYELTAVVDPDPAARASALTATGVPALADPGELRLDQTDLAVVAVPNHLHASVACPLLASGIPVFVEKPVCLTAADVALLAAAERQGAVLLAGSAARYRSDIMALAELARSLGPIRHVELAWVRARGIPQKAGWFTDRALAGGGAFVDLGWHLLDVAFALLGSLRVRDVLGTVSADFLDDARWRASWRGDLADRDLGPSGGDVEDTARVFLVMADNVSVGLRASWASHQGYDATTVTVEGAAGTASLRCTFGFSPNRVAEPALLLLSQGTARPVPFAPDQVGAEYGRQLDALPALLADPGTRGQAIAEAQSAVSVIERLYRTARRPPSPAVPVPDEVHELRSALAAAARGERFVLHALLPVTGGQPADAWPRILAGLRLVTLDAVALLYGSCRPLVTLLELDDTGSADPGDHDRYLTRLALVIRAGLEARPDEVASAQQRMTRLRLPRDPGALAPAVLTELARAVAFMQAWGGDVQAIGHMLRESTYLAGAPGRSAACAQVVVLGRGEPPEHDLSCAEAAGNPVVLRLPPVIRPDLVTALADRLDRGREPGRLVISMGPVTAAHRAGLVAVAEALRREGHAPAYVYQCPATDAGLDQLRLVGDELGSRQLRLAGVSLTIAGRHLEYAARTAGVLAEMTPPHQISEVAGRSVRQ
jgi:oxidoreductase